MFLIHRPAAISEVSDCFTMLPAGFQCEAPLLCDMKDLWREWIRERSMLLSVMHDRSEGEGAPPVAFGASLFATDEFIEYAATGMRPPLAAELARLVRGGRKYVLDRMHVRRANSGEGLNLVVLMIGVAARLADPEAVVRVRAKLLEAFHFYHCGYNIRSITQEIYSREEMQRGLAVGILLRTDYARTLGSRIPPDDLRPYLMGVSRDEVRPGSSAFPIFLFRPPRIHFAPAEQEVLQLALLDFADAEIAESLHVSTSAVHKRWQSILDRAATATGIDWLPSGAVSVDERRAGRGTEKRRRLLSYLRDHLEELRPFLRPAPHAG